MDKSSIDTLEEGEQLALSPQVLGLLGLLVFRLNKDTCSLILKNAPLGGFWRATDPDTNLLILISLRPIKLDLPKGS